jgi:hypothetical protein
MDIEVRTETINTETILSQVAGVVQYTSLNYNASVPLLPQTMEQEMQQLKQWRRMVQSSYPDIVVGYPRYKHKNKTRIEKNWVQLFTGMETEMVEACENIFWQIKFRMQQKFDTIVQPYLQLNLNFNPGYNMSG